MRLIKGLVHVLIRLAVLPFKLALVMLGGTFKAGVKVGGAPVKVGWRVTRAAGISGVFCFVLGLVIGLLFAPSKGREMRAKLRRLLTGQSGLSDEELADRVAFELGHAPRTWHLPQPDVAVVDRRVQLRGTVPHETAREELLRVAANIPGVAGVDDLLELDTAASSEAG
ncbi:BON domain-containing protein [Rhabdothermincola sediminis]|uniref:BON domain-containing protein n=1 Tax=Rhabdothermincola sediminis TaxID=2751370 RepID=UPI001AA01126|nr:BON domain-containing protein [Rhabdothermincola sediminis]